uniref:DUF669 domain-containing protein n=1 Tax=viral metagenome TaxID=1070528 RepID=A0A6H1ZGV2_9ZZZZ
MPLPKDAVLPEEVVYPVLPAGVYVVTIDDIELEIKPSKFKNKDGSPQPDQIQYKVKLITGDDQWVTAWINPSLKVSTKSKRPSLSEFLKAVTGKQYTPEDNDKITGEFLNSLITKELRITTQVRKSETTGKEYATITSFLPLE